LIEVEHYQIRLLSKTLSEQTFIEKPFQEETFWNNATKYTLVCKDESFVEEVAYLMVTLHRTGA